MPTDIATLCFHTRDAVEREDSSFVFEMPRGKLRTGAARVSLASCELPLTQWTIEEDNNRLWINEGIRFDDPEMGHLQLVVRPPGEPEPESPLALELPLELNPIVRAVFRGTALELQFEHPHRLGTGLKLPFCDAPVLLVGSKRGPFDVSELAFEGRLSAPTTHILLLDRAPDVTDATHLRVCGPASPARLCAWLTEAATRYRTTLGLKFEYDAKKDTVIAQAHNLAIGTRLRLLPTVLAARLGLSTTSLVVESPHGSSRTEATMGRMTWPCETTRFWDYVELPCGFYGPCHRTLATSQPRSLATEIEAAANRFYFPLTSQMPQALKDVQSTTPHVLIFSDAAGNVRMCGIPCGQYTPDRLARHLEREMTRIMSDSNLVFSVTHEDDRFTFACEERDAITQRLQPIPFGLLFHHPLSVDPERFGFAAQPLQGSESYVAPERTRVASNGSGPGNGRTMSNILRVSAVGSQKRFRVHATQIPAMVGAAQSLSKGRLKLRTYVNRMPFAHGFLPGDVVQLGRCATSIRVRANAKGEETELSPSPAQLPRHGILVMVLGDGAETSDPCLLELLVPTGLSGLGDVGTCLQITPQAQPYNLCFCKPRTLSPTTVGFPAKAIQWGIDGSVADARGRRFPPFEAPYVHDLDHPDAVLLTFSEQSNAGFQHSFDGETREIFCKLVCYPLLREERMLPRDTSLLRENMSQFRIAFWNPDLRTPYRFHGAEFTFSLSFISAIPDFN